MKYFLQCAHNLAILQKIFSIRKRKIVDGKSDDNIYEIIEN